VASTAERNERRPSKAGPSRPERERALDPGIQKGQPLLTLQTDGRSASGPPMKKTRKIVKGAPITVSIRSEKYCRIFPANFKLASPEPLKGRQPAYKKERMTGKTLNTPLRN